MDDLLPLLLWVFAVVWMLSVCGICIVRSRFGTGERHPEVNPVSWNVVLAQMVSVLFAGALKSFECLQCETWSIWLTKQG